MLDVNLNRKNTYTNDEYFKIIVLSKDLPTSIEQSKWLTNNYKKLLREDIIRCDYKKTSLVCYPRCNGENNNNETKSFEGLYIFVEDRESFDQIANTVKEAYSDLKARALVSTHENGADWAKELNAVFFDRPNRDKVIEALDHLDMDQYDYIESKFNEFDVDKSGYITTDEMPKIATSLGEDHQSESVKGAILAFDKNHDGKISMSEFICWYKLGRKNTIAFTKFYELNNWMDNKIKEHLSWNHLKNMMSTEEINTSTKVTKIDVSLNTQNIEEYISRMNFRLAIGESARKEACRNYLSRYNDKMEYSSDYFIDIGFFTKSCTINGLTAKEYIDRFKTILIDQIDEKLIPGLKSFVDNFFVIRVFESDHSVNLRLEVKYDIQELLKSALSTYLRITQWLTNEGKTPFDLDFNYMSGKNIRDIMEEGGILKDFLESCELKIKFTAIKERNIAFLNSAKHDIKEKLQYFQPFFIPTSLKVKYEGKINELMDSKSKEILSGKVDFMKDFINFFISYLPEDLRKVMARLEFGLNMVDTFFSFQLFSGNMWN